MQNKLDTSLFPCRGRALNHRRAKSLGASLLSASLPFSAFLALGMVSASIALPAQAQTPPAVATYPRALADFTGIVAKTKTTPLNDTVSIMAPTKLALAFPSRVHLVKLILRNETHDWVDISFRYSPRLASDFEWTLPELGETEYYTAEWAILDDQDRLIRGNFSFAFGARARVPSTVRAEQEMFLRTRNGEDESTRFVTPPRTKIILDQEPKAYDPPFTLRLEEGEVDR